MKRLILAAGVAALAIAAPAGAEVDPKGKGKGQAAKVERGGGPKVRAESRGKAQVRTDRRANLRLASAERRPERRQDRAERARDRDDDRRPVRVQQRRDRDDDRRVARIRDGNDNRRVARIRDRDDRVQVRRDTARIARVRDGDGWFVPGRGSPVVNGCPPGLMDKGCMPPGLAKNRLLGQRLPGAYRDRMLPLSLRDLYRDDDDYYYRYGDGYVYRVDRDTQLVNTLLPLIGAGLGLGQVFPTSYMNSYVPSYYQPFYRDNGDDYYRYANGYVYEVDRSTGMIEGMVPLMAGGYGVGQMLPAGYSAYNVPYQYRDLYYDRPDAYYRYAPGAIYQVDPSTSLITSIASLLSPSGFGIGQPLPMGYSTYNVPLAYRDTYYDTPDAWYRYNNGNIYQVDPTTQLVTALVRALV